MKVLVVISLLVSLFCVSNCTNSSNPIVIGSFEYLRFERAGGGQKMFDVYRTAYADTFQFYITKLNFRDTLITFKVAVDSNNTTIFQSLVKSLTSQIQINGDFKQPTLPTGTWSYFYVIKGLEVTEITNSTLRTQLSGLETIVTQYVQ